MQIRVKTFHVCRKRAVHAGDVVGSQTWADGRTKTNVVPKNIHTLFFLVVGDMSRYIVNTIYLEKNKMTYNLERKAQV